MRDCSDEEEAATIEEFYINLIEKKKKVKPAKEEKEPRKNSAPKIVEKVQERIHDRKDKKEKDKLYKEKMEQAKKAQKDNQKSEQLVKEMTQFHETPGGPDDEESPVHPKEEEEAVTKHYTPKVETVIPEVEIDDNMDMKLML